MMRNNTAMAILEHVTNKVFDTVNHEILLDKLDLFISFFL